MAIGTSPVGRWRSTWAPGAARAPGWPTPSWPTGSSLLVLDGRLPTRTRLPAERELASALQVSRTTVAASYDLLRQIGFLRSRRGSGSWTTLPENPTAPELSPFAPAGEGKAFDLAYASLAAPPEAMAGALAWAVEQMACHGTGSGYQLYGLDSLRDVVAARFTQRGLPHHPRPDPDHERGPARHGRGVRRAGHAGRPGARRAPHLSQRAGRHRPRARPCRAGRVRRPGLGPGHHRGRRPGRLSPGGLPDAGLPEPHRPVHERRAAQPRSSSCAAAPTPRC